MACNENTPEAITFRRRFPELVSGIQNPQSLADHLFAENIIVVQVLQEIGKETLATEKTRRLLERLYMSIIYSDPKHFSVFVEILRREAYAEQLVKNLELEYALQQHGPKFPQQHSSQQFPATPCQTSDGQPHFSHGDPHMYSHHPSVSSMAATVGTGLAASHIPQPGSSLQPQHSLSSHTALASSYPPGINMPGMDTAAVPGPGGTYMSQPHYPVPATPFQTSDGHPHFSHDDHHISSLHPSVSAMAAQGLAASHIPQSVPITSSLPLQGSNLQPQHSLGSHNTLASRYPPGIDARDIDTSMVPWPGGMYMSQPYYAVPTASSLPLQGSNLQSQHSLSSRNTLASRYPPGIDARDIDTSMVPWPGGMYMSQPYYAVPTASSLPLQGSNLQSQHRLSSHNTLASRYPPGNSASNIDTSVPGPEVPTASYPPLQRSSLQPQHSLSSHNTLVSRYHPGIHTPGIDMSTVPRPGVPAASPLPLQGSNLQSQHSLSSHSTLASRYPPGSSTSNIDASVPGPGDTCMSQPHYPVPTASPLPLQGSNLLPQHNLGSHSSQASRYPPDITTTSIDTSTVPQPSGQDLLTQNELYDVLNQLHVVRAKWHVLGGSLRVKESVLAATRAEFRDIPDNCLRAIFSHWLRQVNPRPCWSAIVAALRMPIVDEPQLAEALEAKYCPGNPPFQSQHSHGTDGSCMYRSYCSQESRLSSSTESGGTLGTFAELELSSLPLEESHPPHKKHKLQDAGPPFNMYGKKVKSIYIQRQDIPQDDWPPVRKLEYIKLALLNSGAIKDDKYSRDTITGCIDDILKDKEEIEFPQVFMDVQKGCRILFEGRPGSGKTTLMQRISKDWAKGKILDQITVLILIPLRAFVGDNDSIVTIRDVVGFFQPSYLDSLCATIEHNDGQGLCICVDGLDEYSPAGQKKNYIHRLIKREVLTEAVVIVTSRPAASHKFRRAVDRNVEVLGFLKPQIQKYITDYYSRNSAKAEGLIAYLEDHLNVKHACYLPLHLAMVCYLYDIRGASLPERETEIYRHFTLSILVRALSHKQEVMDSESEASQISDFTKLSPENNQIFMKVCELAFKATVQQKQVYSLQEAKDHFSIDQQRKYLGLITVDRQYVLYGHEETCSFLHLTHQEFLAAYHLTQLKEDDVKSCTEQYIRKSYMFVVFKFYFGLTQVRKLAAEEVFKGFLDANKSDQLLLVQCSFESQNTGTCQLLALKGDGIIDIQKKTLNPSDFTALGYVTRSASSALRETHIVSCSVTSEGLQALVKTTDDCSFPGEVLNLHGTRLKIDMAPATADILKKASSVTQLRLSKCGIQLATLSHIAPVLSRMTSLVSLRLEQNDLGVKSFPVLLDVMKMLTNLEELSTDHQFLEKLDSPFSTSQSLMKLSLYDKIKIIDVSRSYTSERKSILLHSEPTQAVLPWLVSLVGELAELCVSITDSNSTGEVKHLNLKEIRLHYLKKPVNFHILEKLVEVCPNLTVLSLQGNRIGESSGAALGEVLKNCPELQSLNLGYNNLGPDGAKSLCLGLKPCTSLQTLNLRSNGITNDAVDSLMELLKTMKDLKELDLYRNNIGPDGAKSLSVGLKHCTSLQTLDLGYNNLGPDGAKSLCLGLKPCTSLQTLNLFQNHITDDAVDSLMELLKTMKDLKELNLAENNIGPDGARTLCLGLEYCTSLQTLNLWHNDITDDAVDSLMELLKTMKDLKKLHLDLNKFTESGKATLRQAAKDRKEQSNFSEVRLYV